MITVSLTHVCPLFKAGSAKLYVNPIIILKKHLLLLVNFGGMETYQISLDSPDPTVVYVIALLVKLLQILLQAHSPLMFPILSWLELCCVMTALYTRTVCTSMCIVRIVRKFSTCLFIYAQCACSLMSGLPASSISI